MSYTHTEATMEREEAVFNALDTRDSEALYHLASLYKDEGDDEQADLLIKAAKKVDEEDGAYDQFKANDN